MENDKIPCQYPPSLGSLCVVGQVVVLTGLFLEVGKETLLGSAPVGDVGRRDVGGEFAASCSGCHGLVVVRENLFPNETSVFVLNVVRHDRLGVGADHDVLEDLVEPVALLLIEIGVDHRVAIFNEVIES